MFGDERIRQVRYRAGIEIDISMTFVALANNFLHNSYSLSPELHTKCLPGAEKCLHFREFFPLEKNQKMRERGQNAGFRLTPM